MFVVVVVVVVVVVLLLLLRSQPAIPLGFTILGEIFAYVTLFLFFLCFYPTIEVVTFRLCRWCTLGVFVAGIHLSRTWMSGSLKSVQWNASVYRLDLGLYSHPKEFLGNGVRTLVYSVGKIPNTECSEEGRCVFVVIWIDSYRSI